MLFLCFARGLVSPGVVRPAVEAPLLGNQGQATGRPVHWSESWGVTQDSRYHGLTRRAVDRGGQAPWLSGEALAFVI